jgi:hypothetical protein
LSLKSSRSFEPFKFLISKNGGEYVNQHFEEYLLQSGIDWRQSVPHTPQHNGVVEHNNQTLFEMARCFFQAKDLPPRFWAEAVYCANYMFNRISTRVVPSMTPSEQWCEKNPSVGQLCVFGCVS